MTVSFMGRGNQCIQLVKFLYCKLPTIGKQLPTFPHRVRGVDCRPQRWEESVLPLSHCGSPIMKILYSQLEPKIWLRASMNMPIDLSTNLITSFPIQSYQHKRIHKDLFISFRVIMNTDRPTSASANLTLYGGGTL